MDAGVIVLAAGRGSRLAGVAAELPKPLVALGGRPLLEWNLRWLAAAGARRVWLNVHHLAARIEEALGDGAAFGVELRYSRETELLGTAGGWRRVATTEPAERWLVVYGDNAMRFDLERLLAAHDASGMAATVALFDPARHANTGIAGGRAALAPDGRVRRFMEGGTVGLVNAGVYVLEAEVAERVPAGYADFGRDVLPGLAEEGRLAGHVMEDGAFCLGVDTPARLREAERMVATAEVRL